MPVAATFSGLGKERIRMCWDNRRAPKRSTMAADSENTLRESKGERPTGITYEAAIEAAKHGGNVDYEGRKVRVVSISSRTEMEMPYSARLDLDLGDEFVVLLGYFRGGEFIEEGRERPF